MRWWRCGSSSLPIMKWIISGSLAPACPKPAVCYSIAEASSVKAASEISLIWPKIWPSRTFSSTSPPAILIAKLDRRNQSSSTIQGVVCSSRPRKNVFTQAANERVCWTASRAALPYTHLAFQRRFKSMQRALRTRPGSRHTMTSCQTSCERPTCSVWMRQRRENVHRSFCSRVSGSGTSSTELQSWTRCCFSRRSRVSLSYTQIWVACSNRF